jgi:hypothetical protein
VVSLAQVQRAARLVVGLETHAAVLQQRAVADDAAVRLILAADVNEWAANGSHFEATLAEAGERRALLTKVTSRAADLRARYDLDGIIGPVPVGFTDEAHRATAKARSTSPMPAEEAAPYRRPLPFL